MNILKKLYTEALDWLDESNNKMEKSTQEMRDNYPEVLNASRTIRKKQLESLEKKLKKVKAKRKALKKKAKAPYKLEPLPHPNDTWYSEELTESELHLCDNYEEEECQYIKYYRPGRYCFSKNIHYKTVKHPIYMRKHKYRAKIN